MFLRHRWLTPLLRGFSLVVVTGQRSDDQANNPLYIGDFRMRSLIAVLALAFCVSVGCDSAAAPKSAPAPAPAAAEAPKAE